MTQRPRRSSRLVAREAARAKASLDKDEPKSESVANGPRKRARAIPKGAKGQDRKSDSELAGVASVKGKGAPKSAASAVKKAKGVNRPTREEEAILWKKGFARVAGTDEAGRGPLAGPVVAAACCIPPEVHIEGIADSKKLTEQQREAAYEAITSHPDIDWAMHVVDADVIDRINILQAALLAMEESVAKMPTPPTYVLVDGNRLPAGLPAERAHSVIKGDDKSYVIAAASIIAKVTRDRLMLEYDKEWPQYDLKNNKGYGTTKHMAAIKAHGPCRIHRRTFAPLKHMDFPAGS